MKWTAVYTLVFSLWAFAADNPQNQIIITLSESGFAETFPDKGILDLEISCMHKDIAKSRECVVAIDTQLLKKLKEAGVKTEDIHAGAIRRHKSHKWEHDRQVFEGYQTTKQISLEAIGINVMEKALDAVLDHEKISLHNTSYGHTKIDSLKTAAYLDAITRLKTRSEAVRQALASKQCDILAISDGQVSEFPTPQPLADGMARSMMVLKEASSPISAQPGKIKIEVTASMKVGCTR
jgi:uncharacterized protein YggE